MYYKDKCVLNRWLAALYPHWQFWACNPSFAASCSPTLTTAVTMYRPLGKLSAHRHPYYRQLGKLSSHRVINRAAVKHGFSNKWLGTWSQIPRADALVTLPWGSGHGHRRTLNCHGLARYWGHIRYQRDAFLFVVSLNQQTKYK